MFSIVFLVESWYNNITTQIEYVLHIMGEVYVFFFFGKNVCSASYALPFYARLRFNLCGSNGSCVFRCVASVAHLFYMLIGGYMEKNIQKKVIDITGVELMPGEPTVCLGNGEQGFECC